MIKKTNTAGIISWIILVIAYMFVMFHRISLGVIQSELVNEFQMSATTFASLNSTYFYVYMIMQLPAGIAADSFGPRKTAGFCFLAAGIGAYLFARANSVLLLFIARTMVGFGVSVILVCILKIQSMWFDPKRFSTMSGIYGFLGNLGAVFAQTPLAVLCSFITWRMSFKLISAITIGISILILVFVKDNKEKVEECIHSDIADAPGRTGNPANSAGLDNSGNLSHERRSDSIKKVLKMPSIWIPFLVLVGLNGAFSSLNGTWGIPYLTAVYDIGKVEAANLLIWLTVGLATGTLLSGYISDKLQKTKEIMIAFSTLSVISWYLLYFYDHGRPPIEIVPILFFFIGIGMSIIVLTYTCAKQAVSPNLAGFAMSFVNMGSFVGASIAPIIMGSVIDSNKNHLSQFDTYHGALIISIIFVTIGYIFVFFINRRRKIL